MLKGIILFIVFTSSAYSFDCKDRKKLVVVLGMHRSGTSLLSKGLQVLGVDFGDHLLAGAEDNPLGFYEDIDIGSYNETLLYLSKLSCDSIKNYPTAIPNKEGLIKYGICLLKNKMGNKLFFGFKDPRTARNINLWKEIFLDLSDIKVKVVIIFRNPISVAQSLYSRNKINPVRSYYLWLQYYISALSIANDFDTYFISYENLVKNPYLEMKRLGKRLGIQLNNYPTAHLKSFAGNYVNLCMQHHQSSVEEIDLQKNIPPEVNVLYKEILKVSDRESNKSKLLKISKKINQRLIELDPLLRMVDEIEKIGESKDYRFFELIEELIDN